MPKRILLALLLVLLPNFLVAQDTGVGIDITSKVAVSGLETLPTYNWTPLRIPGIVAYGQTWNLGNMWVENGGSTPATHPTADADPVGYVDEPVGGFSISAGADASRPTLVSDATINSAVLFDNNSEAWDIDNSQSLLSYMIRVRQGTILFKYKPRVAAGGTANAIMDSIAGSSANNGIYIRRNTVGTLLIQLSGGGSNIVSYSTTDTCNDPDVWYYIRIWFETVGTAQAHCRISGGTDAASNLGAAVAANMTSSLRIGNRTSGSTTLDGRIADIVFTTTENVSDEDYALWVAHNPTRSTSVTEFERYTAIGNSLTPAQVTSFYHSDYDLSDATGLDNLWTTSNQATPVTANAENIGYILNLKTIPVANCLWQRDASQSTDAKRPLYVTNQSNDKSAGRWSGTAADIQSTDGTSDYTGEQNLTFTQWSRGAETFFIILRNNDTALGSHPLSQGYAVYGTMVGSAYPDNPDVQDSYVQHLSSPPAANGPISLNGGEGINIVCVRKDGATCTVYCNNYKGSPSTNATQFLAKQMGRPGITGWDMSGEIFQVVRWNYYASESICQKLTNGFAAKYGVPNTVSTITLARTVPKNWKSRMIAELQGRPLPFTESSTRRMFLGASLN